ncbi:MAG: hypothetical protein HZB51_24295 [Chloroflexi bacterium]|nr:hypothetical protein [Chloroflexota bacterium]
MLGIKDAEHEESSPDASRLIISKLVCSLNGKTETVKIIPGTLAHRVYGKEETVEEFRCNYGLNPEYQNRFVDGKLVVAGIDVDGQFRIIELPERRFFVATLYLPQLLSKPNAPHSLIVAYLKSASKGW